MGAEVARRLAPRRSPGDVVHGQELIEIVRGTKWRGMWRVRCISCGEEKVKKPGSTGCRGCYVKAVAAPLRGCAVCGKPLMQNRRGGGSPCGKRVTCSRVCGGVMRRKNKVGHGRAACRCEFCGQAFYATDARVKRGGARFCSRGCMSKEKRRARLRVCVVCAMQYAARASTRESSTCSYACAGKLTAHRRSKRYLVLGVEMTCAEIASITGEKAGTVASRMRGHRPGGPVPASRVRLSQR